MKDYRLSEIKEICKKNKNCNKCEIGIFECETFFSDIDPIDWEIDKEKDPKDNPKNYKEINDKLC